MTRVFIGLALGVGLAACGGTPPFGLNEGDGDTSKNAVYLTEAQDFLTLNNISYDPASDTLQINNIPFDDPANNYDRILTEAFTNGFDAYDSAPAPGSNEIQYFAVFRRSNSGNSQVAAAGTDGYIDFGYGGAGAQRLGNRPTLPTTGIYSYNGEYAAVRTTRAGTAADGTGFVTGDVRLTADFGDFDEVGSVGGVINNRNVYNDSGALVGTLDGFISLTDGSIDFANALFGGSSTTEVRGGATTATGNWSGIFAGPGGREIAGAVFIEGSDVREVGGFIADCIPADCP